ncbi:MAG: fibronectin type III domain-containing protein, partial [Thermoguttaceae bacterium]|nr:fibronectin type III domain-containing protein [Thermoguttaceae bacterium]
DEPVGRGVPGITISGGNMTRVFRIDPLAGSVKIIGVKFADGKTTQISNTQSAEEFNGGAIYARNVDLTLENCVFENNQGTGSGGAVSIYNDSSHILTIANTQFIGNRVSFSYDANNEVTGRGGALRIYSPYSRSQLSISNSIFYDNSTEQSASYGNGGAINASGFDARIDRSVFKKNASCYGGTINYGGNWSISNSIFAENTASVCGGAIEAYSGSGETVLRLYNSTIVGNITNSSNSYGAVFLQSNGGKTRFEAYNSIVAYNAQGLASTGAKDVSVLAQTGGVVETLARNVMTSYTGWTDAIRPDSNGQNGDYIAGPASASLIFYLSKGSNNYQYELRQTAIAQGAVNRRLASDLTRYSGHVVTAVDLLNKARVANVGVDMGAYEYNSADPTLASITVSGDLLVGSTLEARFVSAAAPAAEYEWYRATTANATQGVWGNPISGATGSSYELTMADAGYCLRVVAKGTGVFDGQRVEASTSEVVSGTLDVPTATVIEEGVDSLTVSWNSISRAQRYAISYRAADSEEWTTISLAKNAPELIVDGSTVAYRVEGLAPNTNYEVTVQARGNNTSLVHSEVSESVFGVTLDDSLRLDGVVGDCEAGGTLTAALATDATASYQWYVAGEYDQWIEIPGATSSTYQTKSSDVGKRFIVVATSTDDLYQGFDFASAETAVWTKLPAPALRVDSVEDGAISLSWSPVENATGYVITARAVGDEYWESSPIIDMDETGVTLEELDPGLSYEFRIMALGEGDLYANSEYSETVSSQGTVAALSVTSYDPETRVATIEWGAISGASKYMVKLSKDGGATWSNYKTNVTTTS